MSLSIPTAPLTMVPASRPFQLKPSQLRSPSPALSAPLLFAGADALKKSLDGRKIAISSDIDDTLIQWSLKNKQGLPLGLPETLKYFQKNREHLLLALNTGRGLVSMQELIGSIRKLPKQLLENLPLKALVVNNGQMIFHNTAQQSLVDWVPTLTQDQQDKTWQSALAHVTGWNLEIVTQVLHQEILKAGFKELPPADPPALTVKKSYIKTLPGGKQLILNRFPDQPSFRLVSETPDPTLKELQLAENVAQKVLASLHAKGWDVEMRQSHFAVTNPKGGSPLNQCIFIYKPRPIHKGAAFQYLLRLWEATEPKPIAGVITAGDDDYNDSEMLKHPYHDLSGEAYHSLPIISGNRLNLLRLMAQVKNTVQIPAGTLLDGIKTQIRKIVRRQKREVQNPG